MTIEEFVQIYMQDVETTVIFVDNPMFKKAPAY